MAELLLEIMFIFCVCVCVCARARVCTVQVCLHVNECVCPMAAG